MGFCTFCGKQLADGEVCNCEQSRQAQAQQAAQTQQAQGRANAKASRGKYGGCFQRRAGQPGSHGDGGWKTSNMA